MQRNNSLRNPEWDYRSRGIYFITIITKNRSPYFGNIVSGILEKTEIGSLVHNYWHEIPLHFKNIQLGQYIIMPDHLHGIIHIKKQVNNRIINYLDEDLKNSKNVHMASISPKPSSLSTIIRSFKSAVTKDARKIDLEFAWQRSFHDKIIQKSEIPFYNKYMEENPGYFNETQ
ncbi:transposase [Mangrovivirga cuniculi]|uniref:Transposase IS200-like domain-containing protein n=1 Tax=Mangrovivirga cuniculi TaxID=2715131 RepID=A0A4D7K115_9BACT|nr:transposase [Mangrovivirga cuniculi]QCK16615.1 hypothetical protein DCC35_18705 [Mangrovivirga cuniculi]